LLVPVLSRDVFQDPTRRTAEAALGLGLAHRKLNYDAPLGTPLGTAIAAPVPQTRELMCRDGLKYYARIPGKNIRAAQEEVEKQRAVLHAARPRRCAGEVIALEFDLAARMAVQSCRIMLWQQAVVAGRTAQARRMAAAGIRALEELDRDRVASLAEPARRRCAAFLAGVCRIIAMEPSITGEQRGAGAECPLGALYLSRMFREYSLTGLQRNIWKDRCAVQKWFDRRRARMSGGAGFCIRTLQIATASNRSGTDNSTAMTRRQLISGRRRRCCSSVDQRGFIFYTIDSRRDKAGGKYGQHWSSIGRIGRQVCIARSH
jgi:hypothetical protein